MELITTTIKRKGKRSVRRHLFITTVRTTPEALLRLIWGYPDSVDRFQGSTGVSVRVLMACCSYSIGLR